jgi:hypothetical protein
MRTVEALRQGLAEPARIGGQLYGSQCGHHRTEMLDETFGVVMDRARALAVDSHEIGRQSPRRALGHGANFGRVRRSGI